MKNNKAKRFMKNLSWVFILFCLNIAGANAQVKVSGTVTDKNKDPLIGVNIIVKGSQTGTISDVNGNYTIQAPNNKSVISFSYIGYRSVEKTAASTTINISLQEETHQMDEMVVIGYGSQKKSHLTGAVSSLKNEKLDEIPVSSVAQALQGKLAGVQILPISLVMPEQR